MDTSTEPQDELLAHTEWQPATGMTVTNRLVLRRTADTDEFVSHYECLEDGRRYYVEGNYLGRHGTPERERAALALAELEDRSARRGYGPVEVTDKGAEYGLGQPDDPDAGPDL